MNTWINKCNYSSEKTIPYREHHFKEKIHQRDIQSFGKNFNQILTYTFLYQEEQKE